MSVPAEAFDRAADRYAAYVEGPDGRERTQAAWRFLARYVRPGGLALDAGGGAGTLARELRATCRAVALLDRSPAMLRLARDRLAPANVLLVRGDVHAPPFRDRSFAFVACHHVLEYLDDRGAPLGALADCVARGGRLSVVGLAAGADGDGHRDDLFGRVRRGVALGDLARALHGRGLRTVACRATARHVQLVAERSA